MKKIVKVREGYVARKQATIKVVVRGKVYYVDSKFASFHKEKATKERRN